MLYFSKTSFLVSVNEPACKRYKYTPLGKSAPVHCREYVPADNSSDITVDTSLPKVSNTFSDTNDLDGRLNEIVVDGLNGFG